jgi:cytochrome b561
MRYDAGAVLLHWMIALLVLAQLALGFWMVALPDEGGGQVRWFNLHKSIGLSLAVLVLARLAWRAVHPAPAYPAGFPLWQQRAARAAHGGLYFCLLALALTGYLGSSFSGYPVRYFGIVLPGWGWKWPAAKLLLSDVHLALTWLLGALILLHVAAAVGHLLRRDGLFARMWPNWRNA